MTPEGNFVMIIPITDGQFPKVPTMWGPQDMFVGLDKLQ